MKDTVQPLIGQLIGLAASHALTWLGHTKMLLTTILLPVVGARIVSWPTRETARTIARDPRRE